MADTPQVQYASAQVELGAAVAEKGLMIAIKTTDLEAYKAADAANLVVIGINEQVGVEGDTITVYAGCFLFDNSAVYPVTQAYINANVYVEDEHTVSVSAGSHTRVAGKCVDVVAEGVWVQVGVAV